MHSHELFLPDVSYGDVDQFHDRYDRDPYGKPYWDMQYGQQLHQANRCEYDICNRIQP